MIDIIGLDKVQLFMELYNHARPCTFFYTYDRISYEEAKEALNLSLNIIKYRDKKLYLDFRCDVLDSEKYNYEYGEDSVEKIVYALRRNKNEYS